MKQLDRSRPFGQSFPPDGDRVYQQDDRWFDVHGNEIIAVQVTADVPPKPAEPRKPGRPKKVETQAEPTVTPEPDSQVAAQLAEGDDA